MKTKIFLILFATIILLVGCKKNDIETFKSDAIVIFEGDPAIDGCGYFLLISNEKYKPVTLEQQFCEDSLYVEIKYQIIGKWSCNWNVKQYEQIKIIEIKRK